MIVADMRCARMYLRSGIFIEACEKRDHLLIEDVALGTSRKLGGF